MNALQLTRSKTVQLFCTKHICKSQAFHTPNTETFAQPSTADWADLPRKLKQQVVGYVNVSELCALRATNREINKATTPAFNRLFEHVAIQLQPHSIQVLGEIAQHVQLRELVRSLTIIVTTSFNIASDSSQRLKYPLTTALQGLLNFHSLGFQFYTNSDTQTSPDGDQRLRHPR